MEELYNTTYWAQDKFDHVITRHSMFSIRTTKWTIHEFRCGMDILLGNAIAICYHGVSNSFKGAWLDRGELMMAVVQRYKEGYKNPDSIEKPTRPAPLNISKVVTSIENDDVYDADSDNDSSDEENIGPKRGKKRTCKEKKCNRRSEFRCEICKAPWCTGTHGVRVCRKHLVGL